MNKKLVLDATRLERMNERKKSQKKKKENERKAKAKKNAIKGKNQPSLPPINPLSKTATLVSKDSEHPY